LEERGFLVDFLKALFPNIARPQGQISAAQDLPGMGYKAESISCHATSADEVLPFPGPAQLA
jgi:hypothetical protein